MIAEVSMAELDRRLAEAGPLLVDFWSPVCGRCYALRPQLEKAFEGDDMSAVAVNAFEEPELVSRYEVQSLPTVLLLQGGSVRRRFTDPILSTEVVDALREMQRSFAQ
jgi:thioredoxin 1